jgi:glucokinase
MKHAPNTLSLVADIGGTNTRVALADGHQVLENTTRKFRNADFADLETVLRKFLADEGKINTKAACVAVAGPVQDGKATLTNLNWTIDEATLANATQAETVAILNDLQAQGHALGHLDPVNVRPVLKGVEPEFHATKLVVGVGTGFNATPVFETSSRRLAAPSESGHINLPIRTEEDLHLSTYLTEQHGFAAVEDVLSGRGIEAVYGFFSQGVTAPKRPSAEEIMRAVAIGDDPVADKTAKLLTRVLGTVCGNLALVQLPFGGIYLVGGVSRALAPYLAKCNFEAAFNDKGRFESFMKTFPVHVIEDDYAALIGSATYLVDIMKDESPK